MSHITFTMPEWHNFCNAFGLDVDGSLARLKSLKIESLKREKSKPIMASSLIPTTLDTIKNAGREWVRKVIKQGITQTAPGSIKYLLFGARPSQQAISIKFGKFGEFLAMEMIKGLPHLELLKCGVRCIDKESKKNKDFDLVWADHEKKIIGYRELKGNIEMDSEKIPATIDKVKKLLEHLTTTSLSGYTIDSGILNWSIYDRAILTKGKSNIKKCEENGVKVEHMGDFLETIKFEWNQTDFYDYMKEVGNMVETGLFANNS